MPETVGVAWMERSLRNAIQLKWMLGLVLAAEVMPWLIKLFT